jgi:hypothetical protein
VALTRSWRQWWTGADVHVHGLQPAEIALDAGQPLVGGDYAGSVRVLVVTLVRST